MKFLSLLVVTIFAHVCCGSLRAADEPRLNVLMIAVDDMRPQLGCYGDTTIKSPNIDRLATQSLLFERAYCQQALCSPSRISLLSGRRPETSGIHSIGPTLRSAMPDITTLPQHFKNNGYHTRSIGKVYHVGIDDPASWSEPSIQAKKPRHGPASQKLIAERKQMHAKAGTKAPEKGNGSIGYASLPFESVDCADDELLDGDAARLGVEALQTLAKKPQQPFFLAVGFANPHVPWIAPKKYFDLYDPAKLPRAEFPRVPAAAPAFAATTGMDFHWYTGVPKDVPPAYGAECLQAYLASISYIDAQIGRLLDELDRLDLRKNTVIVLWGDHGYYMGEHDWWGSKHNNYEGATRVALLFSAPGMKAAGKKTRALTEFVDIYPSLAAVCKLPTPESGIEGTSFAPLLDDPARAWKQAAFSSYPKGGYHGIAMRTDRYRFVQWTKKNEAAVYELYDYQTDPLEKRNLAGEADSQALVKELAAQLEAGWRAAGPNGASQ